MKPLAKITMGMAILVIATLGVVGVALLSGTFDFSATTEPSAIEQKLAHFVLDRSIKRRAPKVINPLPSSPHVMQEGVSHYRTNCLVCHGAPGIEPFELGKGLNPRAPDLSAAAVQARSDGELFWIIRHGIRMTGMPAFQPTHSDEELWALVAMVRRLPRLTEGERASLQGAHEAQEHRHEAEPPPATESHHHEADSSAAAPLKASTSPERAHRTPAHRHEAEQTPASKSQHHTPDRSPAHPPTHHAKPDSPHVAPDTTETMHQEHLEGTKPGASHEHDLGAHEESAHEPSTPGQHASHGEEMESMSGLYGSYPISRESSGTAWQPELASHEGAHLMRGDWMLLAHGFVTAVYDHQGGMRGDEDVFSANMLMGMARRAFGRATLGLRAMFSAEPATIGKEGYPLLLQTGETADGREPLIDRQHPHDLFMELAASFSVASADQSAFLYLGMPGEPALGPPAFMHRFSGAAAPLAPISHHWLDSTHITYGVATLGIVKGPLKLDGSLFTGREPDEERVGWDSPDLDSHAIRLSYNPTPAWSIQASFGRMESPEQLHPDVDVDRITASVICNPRRARGNTQIMLAWGQNENQPGNTLDMFLAEAATTLGVRHTLFARVERGEKDELFLESDPRADRVFTVGQAGVGYIYDVVMTDHLAAGLGGSAGISFVPEDLESEYGDEPFSGTLFARAMLK